MLSWVQQSDSPAAQFAVERLLVCEAQLDYWQGTPKEKTWEEHWRRAYATLEAENAKVR